MFQTTAVHMTNIRRHIRSDTLMVSALDMIDHFTQTARVRVIFDDDMMIFTSIFFKKNLLLA